MRPWKSLITRCASSLRPPRASKFANPYAASGLLGSNRARRAVLSTLWGGINVSSSRTISEKDLQNIVVAEGGKELAHELEAKGYEHIAGKAA